MARKLTKAQCEARFQALDEAAEHLTLAWTDNPIEQQEGYAMSQWLREQARIWLSKAEGRQ